MLFTYFRGNWKDYWLPIVEVGRDPAKVPDVIRGLAAVGIMDGATINGTKALRKHQRKADLFR